MKRSLILAIPFLILLGFLVPPPVAVVSVANVADFGAVSDGQRASAGKNTQAFQQAIATGLPVYVPTGAGHGYMVNNGQIEITQGGQELYGDASMGSNPSWGAITSTIIGVGKGSTITSSVLGTHIHNLAFTPSKVGEQGPGDGFILINGGSQVSVNDCCFSSPMNGIVVAIPVGQGGEYWIKNCLMQDAIGISGINADTGGGTLQCSHVIMYSDNPQPPYGIVVTNAGEVIINDGCDIINCGNCLALVPGVSGVKNQQIIATAISDSLFDGGNGLGCVYICPRNGGFVSRVAFSNVWTSTSNNNNGQWNTNGFTFDGTQTVPVLPGVSAIQDVSLVNCLGQHFINHCGLYAKGVNAISVQNSTFGGNFNGIQIAPKCSSFSLVGNKCGNYAIPAQNANGGNAAYGIFIEPNDQFLVTNNLLYGNKLGGLINQSVPSARQIVGWNLW